MTTIILIVIYIAFISLGLPDSILGSAWPSMYERLNVPVGYAGIITMIIAGGTIISSLASNFLKKKIGTGRIMVYSVALTAIALLGFSKSTQFWQLCLLAVPYGLGAGSVDSALNNYVALHYKARHMGFLHCFWGIGTMISPFVMSEFIARGGIWTQGYKAVGIFQVALTAILVLSLPLWTKMEGKPGTAKDEESVAESNMTMAVAIKRPGVLPAILTFLAYCSIESVTGLWASTYMVFARGIELTTATSWAMLFYVGITVGRFITGFVSEKIGDKKLIRIGIGVMAIGYVILMLPFSSKWFVFAGLIIAGLGCAPLYPCMIHQTPILFGKDASQALIGLQMASAYTGSTFMPPLFGLIVNCFSVKLLPFAGIFFVIILIVLSELKNSSSKALPSS